jgi:hypothetical protein
VPHWLPYLTAAELGLTPGRKLTLDPTGAIRYEPEPSGLVNLRESAELDLTTLEATAGSS